MEEESSNESWSVDVLRVHIQRLGQLLEDQKLFTAERFRSSDKAVESALIQADKAVQAALLAAEKAVNKAETAAERRFESVNEFRAQLADQAQTFMPRAEAEARINAVSLRVNANTDKIDSLAARINNQEGNKKGGQQTIGYFVVAATVAMGIIGLIITVLLR